MSTDAHVAVTEGSGKNIDNAQVTTGDGTVYRQRVEAYPGAAFDVAFTNSVTVGNTSLAVNFTNAVTVGNASVPVNFTNAVTIGNPAVPVSFTNSVTVGNTSLAVNFTNTVTLAGTSVVAVQPTTASARSFTAFSDFGSNATANVKASPGHLASIWATNENTSQRYLQIHNKATAASAADVPVFSFAIPAGASGYPATIEVGAGFLGANGVYLSTGVTWAISTTKGTYTAATASDHCVNGTYI